MRTLIPAMVRIKNKSLGWWFKMKKKGNGNFLMYKGYGYQLIGYTKTKRNAELFKKTVEKNNFKVRIAKKRLISNKKRVKFGVYGLRWD